jgi:hypothetical protein
MRPRVMSAFPPLLSVEQTSVAQPPNEYTPLIAFARHDLETAIGASVLVQKFIGLRVGLGRVVEAEALDPRDIAASWLRRHWGSVPWS